jgi:organic radical activating enzyme
MEFFPINEMFNSVQGEGTMAGTLQFFVRFASCNLECSFCDTEWKPVMQKLTHIELVTDIRAKVHGAWISWTGGEPTTVLDDTLLAALDSPFLMQLETNGSIGEEQMDGKAWMNRIHHISVSPKRGKEYTDWDKWIAFVRKMNRYRTVDIRFPIGLDEDFRATAEDIQWWQPWTWAQLKRLAGSRGINVWISPIWIDGKVPQQTLDLCLKVLGTFRAQLVDLRLGTQVHKYLKIR